MADNNFKNVRVVAWKIVQYLNQDNTSDTDLGDDDVK